MLDDLEAVIKYIDCSIMSAGGRSTIELIQLDEKMWLLQVDIDKDEARLEVGYNHSATDTLCLISSNLLMHCVKSAVSYNY